MKVIKTKYGKLAVDGFVHVSVARISWIDLFGLMFLTSQGFVSTPRVKPCFLFGELELLISFLPVVVLAMAATTNYPYEVHFTKSGNWFHKSNGFHAQKQ